MKNFTPGLHFRSLEKSITLALAAFIFVFVALQSEAIGQWTAAGGTGFSNANAGNPRNVDNISGFATWGNNLLADATCSIDLLQPPGATPDSLFLSTDNGQTWTSFGPNGGIPILAVGTGSNSVLLGRAELQFGDINLTDEFLAYSTDGGQTWLADTAGNEGAGAGRALAAIGSTIFSGYYQQTAPGAQWVADTIGLPLVAGANGSGAVSFGGPFVAGTNLFGNAGFAGIVFSNNQGQSWTTVNTGIPSFTSGGLLQWYWVYNFASSGNSVFAQVTHDLKGSGTDGDPYYADPYSTDIYRTTNNGQNWTKMNSIPLNYWGNTNGFTASGQDLFAVTDSGFYASTDNGATWNRSEQGLQIAGDLPTSVQISGQNVVIGTTSNGVWYRKLSDFVGSSVAPSSTPIAGLNLTLSSNPTSGSDERISYTLGDGGAAEVMLMDELGRSVRMLQNGRVSAGENTIALDPQSLAPGTYFVRVIAGETSAMQKLVVPR